MNKMLLYEAGNNEYFLDSTRWELLQNLKFSELNA